MSLNIVIYKSVVLRAKRATVDGFVQDWAGLVPTTGHAMKPTEMEQVSKVDFPQDPANLDFEN